MIDEPDHSHPGRVPARVVATPPSGGWLGSGTDEGRAKLRYASGKRMELLIRGLPNGTS